MFTKDDFDKEFEKDEELDVAIDDLIAMIGQAIKNDEGKPYVVNDQKVEQVLFTYKLMKYFTKDQRGVSVSYKLHEPFRSFGSVSICGKDIKFTNQAWFLKAAEIADTFEVYPKTNGTVQMNFGFTGLTSIVK